MRMGETPTPRRLAGRSKWDEQPTGGNTSSGGETPILGTQRDANLMTPTPEISGTKKQMWRPEGEASEKGRPITDEELDQLLPSQGYEVFFLPSIYVDCQASRGVSAIEELEENSRSHAIE
jgi:splicing factor 3B subunit 1